MNLAGRLIAGAGALGVLVAGCAAAAQMKALQPDAAPSLASSGGGMQRGVDVDAYTYQGQDIPAAASAVVKYALSLHANAISITFPFFMKGLDALGVSTRESTPTPHEMAVITRTAEKYGLYVVFRPLLDEASIGYQFRGNMRPRDPAHWFASYRRFLIPYAKAAQRAGAQEFVVGTELSSLYKSPRWGPLDTAVRRVYRGTLAFDSNWWGVPSLGGAGGKGLAEGVDAYPGIPTHIAQGWKVYDHRLPAGTVEMEVGIAAVQGAFAAPYKHRWPGKPVDESVQARWFTAACHAAEAAHLGGIYFWSINLSTKQSPPTPDAAGSWAHGAGATAISRCFGAIEKDHK